MRNTNRKWLTGYVLLEALVAVLVVALGVLALAKLEGIVLSSSGESKARSEAMQIAQSRLDSLRNSILQAQFVEQLPVDDAGSESHPGQNATYTLAWNISTPDTDQRLIKLSASWTDRFGAAQSVQLNGMVAWNDPVSQANLTRETNGNIISPTGAAKRGDGPYTGQGVEQRLGDGNKRELVDSQTGRVILYLDPDANGDAQSFTTINGRVYFDYAERSRTPDSTDVRVRLSSEGECIYDNTSASQVVVPSGATGNAIKYTYFTYQCFVGPGWYGNVGVTIDADVSGNAANPTICLGDPGFNAGVSNSTLTSAHPVEAATRSYRGFRASGSTYLTTGIKGGRTYPNDGAPVPSNYPSYYPSVTAGSANDHFDQNFLVTHIPNNGSCKSRLELVADEFSRNAGKYYCLAPDSDTAHADACPTVWPGFEAEVGSGGSINWTLSVTKDGQGTGVVASNPSGIACGTTCSASYASGASVALTATPDNGSTFVGWAGACSGTGACSVAMTANQAVTATFTTGSTLYNLNVTKVGNGTGRVVSAPVGIDCGTTCTFGFAPNTSVTLTATANTGMVFTGWSGGGCSGTGVCTVAMAAATDITATFSTTAPTLFTLQVAKTGAGSGTVTSVPTGIDCGSTCSASFASDSAVTLTASPASGSGFAGWSGGGCSGSAPTCVVTMASAQSVTAQFALSTCSTQISGTAHDKFGDVTVAPSSAGTCSMAGNTAGFTCTLTTTPGLQVTLTNARNAGGNSYSYSLGVAADCTSQVNVNFPQ